MKDIRPAVLLFASVLLRPPPSSSVCPSSALLFDWPGLASALLCPVALFGSRVLNS